MFNVHMLDMMRSDILIQV